MDTTKFESGGVGKCIKLGEEWITPNEFEKRSNCRSKKYIISIKCMGKPLKYFIDNGQLDGSGLRNHKPGKGNLNKIKLSPPKGRLFSKEMVTCA